MPGMQCTTIDYYFWTSSDWAYFGNPRLKEMAVSFGLTINYYPVDLATVYSRTGGIKLKDRSVERKNYRLDEMRRYSAMLEMPIVMQPKHPIVSTEMSSRVIIAAKEQGIDVHELTHEIMGRRWVHDEDIEDEWVLKQILDGLGLDADTLWKNASQGWTNDRYKQYTEEAIARGVFGSPFYFYGNEKFWGQDRLDILRSYVRLTLIDSTGA